MNQKLVEQYVTGRLDEAQAKAFEESCLLDPELARQVDLEQRLKLGLAQVAENPLEFVRSRSYGWKLAIAATVLVVVTAGVWVFERGPQPTGRALAAVVPELQRGGISMRLALVRGEEGMPQLPGGEVRVGIAGLFETAALYSVSLDRLQPHEPAQTIATLEGQQPASSLTLEVMIDSDQLPSGTYSLRVHRQGSDEEPLDFGFIKP
jgi:hypothetical protein